MTYSIRAKTSREPRLIFRIWRGTKAMMPDGCWTIPGWGFYVANVQPNDQEQPIYDSWEDEFSQIILYPQLYTEEKLRWYEDDTNEEIELGDVPSKIKT